jgi:uncharacterized cupredoxin-like copper-binding protein
MGRRIVPPGLRLLGIGFALILAACTVGAAPTWSFPAASIQGAGTLPSGSPSPATSPGATPAPSEASGSSPSPVASPATPAPSVASAPSPSAGASPSATPRPPGPPDPGEPGFIAGTKAKPRTISIAVTDLLLFDPTVVSVQQGETITFRISNAGQATHEFKVGPMRDVFDDVPSTPEIAGITPGSTKSLTFTFSGTGPYAYACHAPGHFENGMFGFVNVIPTTPWLGTPTHPRMIVIRMDDHLEFVPSEVSVTPGETILFVLPNVGTAQTHEFQIGPADRVALDQVDGQIVVEADKIEPLHIDYLTYTFGGVGPYAFACHEPGHYEAGMKGVIDLTP